jgi:hypothetical protein
VALEVREGFSEAELHDNSSFRTEPEGFPFYTSKVKAFCGFNYLCCVV